jgi:ribonucleoside-diphosphate reductase alpha chain
VTSLDITPEDHIKALASIQKWVDSSISKTNNFPADATTESMRESYLLAYKLGCKDITVFRDSSIKDQVLVANKRKRTEETTKPIASLQLEDPSEKSKGSNNPHTIGISNTTDQTYVMEYRNQTGNGDVCPICDSQIFFLEGCATCPDCGWGLCA